MLKTKRCILIELKTSDLDDIKKLYLNEQVRRYLGGTWKEVDIEASFSRMLQSSSNSIYLTVKVKQSHKFVGLVSLNPHHDKETIELSYQFLPEWWGAGYAFEVLQELLDYAFFQLNLPKVVAETQSANVASCKLLEKLDMEACKTVIRFGAEQVIYSIERKICNGTKITKSWNYLFTSE